MSYQVIYIMPCVTHFLIELSDLLIDHHPWPNFTEIWCVTWKVVSLVACMHGQYLMERAFYSFHYSCLQRNIVLEVLDEWKDIKLGFYLGMLPYGILLMSDDDNIQGNVFDYDIQENVSTTQLMWSNRVTSWENTVTPL